MDQAANLMVLVRENRHLKMAGTFGLHDVPPQKTIKTKGECRLGVNFVLHLGTMFEGNEI